MMISNTVRESPAGQIIRFFHPKLLPHREELETFTYKTNYQYAELAVRSSIPPMLSENTIPYSGDEHLSPTQADVEACASEKAQDDHQALPVICKDGAILCDWYCSSDPDNPENWPAPKKVWVVANICCCSFVVYMSAPIWTLGEEQFMNIFGTNYEYTSLGLALFVFGYGVGPLLFAPLSEIASVGRNLPYITAFVLYMVVTIPTALVRNAPAFMFLRFLQGFFGSPVLATGGASLADVYGSTYLPCAMTGWAFACFVAPTVGQIIAGAAVPYLCWPFTIWESLIASAPIGVMLLFLPETSAATILHHRACRLRELTGSDNIRSASEIEQKGISFRKIVIDSLIKPLEITLLDPAILFANVYMCLIYGIYYSFFEAFPLVYGDIYGFTLLQQGLAFLPITVGTVLSFLLYVSYLVFYRVSLLNYKETFRD